MRQSDKKYITTQDQHEPGIKLHLDPLSIFLYFTLTAISVLFVGLTMAYLYTRFQAGMQAFVLPLVFHANTVVIIASSFTLYYAVRAANEDKLQQYIIGASATLLMGVAFIAFQYLGWQEMIQAGLGVDSTAASYLYLISGLHVLHVVGGIVALGISITQCYFRIHDPVKGLLFSTDPFRKKGVGHIATYWHFVDGLWLYLYLFFLVNSFF